jgi:hypothetical protein
MRARISWLSAGSCVLALVACNEILDNREGVLHREIGPPETSPTHPEKADGGFATPPASSTSDATPRGGTDAATPNAPADASACPPGLETTSKTCGTQCVSLNDPEHGCAAEACAPCDVPNAIPACVNGACALFSCALGYADCNASPVDGCETDLASPTTCGSCSTVCPMAPHAIASCNGICTLECEAGWGDCNGDPVDGCETNLVEDHANCGQCGQGCLFGVCMNGQCFIL